MKKKRITYGVSGMIEYQAVISVGRNTAKVSFTGGSQTSSGMRPASFTTDNLILQNAIESCPDYKRGRIYTVNVIELDEDINVEGRRVRSHSDVTDASAVTDTLDAAQESSKKKSKTVKATEEQTAAAEEAMARAAAGGEPQVMEVSCKDVAKQYLQDRYGVNPAGLYTREDVAREALKYGIIFKYD
jgi:hypothetical protein